MKKLSELVLIITTIMLMIFGIVNIVREIVTTQRLFVICIFGIITVTSALWFWHETKDKEEEE